MTGPGPIAAAALWREVIEAAAGWCQCTGGCGRQHRKSAGGRCERMDSPLSPLRAVPRELAEPAAAAALPASALHALCGPCADGLARCQHRTAAAAAAAGLATASDVLF